MFDDSFVESMSQDWRMIRSKLDVLVIGVEVRNKYIIYKYILQQNIDFVSGNEFSIGCFELDYS